MIATYPFRIRLRLPVIGFVVFGALTALLYVAATRPGADPKGVPAILGLGGVLMLFPLMLLVVQLRNRKKVIVVRDDGIDVPNRLTAGVARIPWASLQRVEERVIKKGAVVVGRALWLHHGAAPTQILESDLGPEAFGQIAAVLARHTRR